MDVMLMVAIFSMIRVNAVLSNTVEDNLLHRLLEANKRKLLTIPAAHHVGHPLRLDVRLSLKKIIKVDEQNEMLYSQYWLEYRWMDHRLMWNASEFEGLDMIYIHVTKMWTPDVSLYNNAQQQRKGDRSPQSEYVRVLNNGTCVWWPMYEQSVSHCPINVTWFPFDDQQCCLIYESWKYNSSQLSISAVLTPSIVHHFQESEQWELLDIHLEDSLTPYLCCFNWSRSTFTLHLRRKYMYHVIHLVMPYCLFSVISVLTLVLQPSRPERLHLGMTMLLTLSVYQLTIRSELPNKSGSTPIIGAYFLFVFIMCYVSLAISIFIVYIHGRANVVPPSPMPPRARQLICGRLAPLLSFRTIKQSPHIDGRSRIDSEDNRQSDSDREDIDQNTAEDSANKDQTLTSIRDLLETRISVDDEDRQKSKKDAKMKRDWMLAAAVIDRLCLIALIVVFIVGTLVFVVLILLS